MTRSEWVVGLAVMLCSADAALAQSMPAQDDRLVTATARTRASLSPDGPWLPRAARSGDVLQVLRDDGARIEIREDVSGVRLAMYVDRATLQTVVCGGSPHLYPHPLSAARCPRRARNHPKARLSQ